MEKLPNIINRFKCFQNRNAGKKSKLITLEKTPG